MTSCTDDVVMTEFTDVMEYVTSDDLFDQGQLDFIGWKSSSNGETNCSRSSVNTITLEGYTAKSSTGNQKVLVQKSLADLIGVSSQIYILEYVTAYQDFKISGLGATSFFSTADSPQCGVDPNGANWAVRGYSASTPTSDGNIRLASKCIHIICDISGKNYDKWYPCKPEQFKWNYTLVNL